MDGVLGTHRLYRNRNWHAKSPVRTLISLWLSKHREETNLVEVGSRLHWLARDADVEDWHSALAILDDEPLSAS